MTTHRVWANRALVRLRRLLGCACAHCGKTSRHALLEFDCITPQGDRHHRFETDRRATFYLTECRKTG